MCSFKINGRTTALRHSSRSSGQIVHSCSVSAPFFQNVFPVTYRCTETFFTAWSVSSGGLSMHHEAGQDRWMLGTVRAGARLRPVSYWSWWGSSPWIQILCSCMLDHPTMFLPWFQGYPVKSLYKSWGRVRYSKSLYSISVSDFGQAVTWYQAKDDGS